MLDWLRWAICRLTHRRITRPVNGRYRCLECLRLFTVHWEPPCGPPRLTAPLLPPVSKSAPTFRFIPEPMAAEVRQQFHEACTAANRIAHRQAQERLRADFDAGRCEYTELERIWRLEP